MPRSDRKLPVWCKEAKKELIDRDLSITAFADEIGMSRTYVSQVINGIRYAPEIANKISAALDLDVKYAENII